MRALALDGWGKPLVLKEIPKPEVAPGDVRVRIRATGLCHSDVHQWKGDWPTERALMESGGVTVLGHEGIGVVDAVGVGVSELAVGDRVGVPWMNYWCGGCEPCLTGYPHWCDRTRTTSVTVNGTYAEYATVSERAAVRVPASIPDDEAAPLLCAGVTAYGALRRLTTELRIPPGKWVAVVGAAGGLGHLGVQLAKAMGYRVVGVDVGADRVRFVESLGADMAVEAAAAPARVQELGGVHATVVFTPTLAGYGLAASLTRTVGGVVAVGIPDAREGPIPISPWALLSRGLRLVPTSVGVSHEFAELFDLYRAGRVRTHVDRHGTLADAPALLADMAGGRYVGRAVVTV